LVEIVVSLSVMSILMLAMGSTLLVATRALPNAERVTSKLNQASQIAEQMTAELQEARHITEQSAGAITFTVADRDGNGSPECIRYAWSGTAGDPLTRQYNHGSVVDVLEDVHAFDLGYDLQAVTEEYPGGPGPGAPIDGEEVVLSSYDPSDSAEYWALDKQADPGLGQYFLPTAPYSALAWRVTRVKFTASPFGNDSGKTDVKLVVPDASGLPTGATLAEDALWETSLTPGYTWQEFSFDGAAARNAGEGLCLVLEAAAGNDAAMYYEFFGTGSGLLRYPKGGPWSYYSSLSTRHYIYGRFQSPPPGPPQTATRQYVTGVRVSLQIGADAASRIDTAVRTPNIPELLSAVWELDFDTDPTTLDMNGDATKDWNLRRGGSIDPGDLLNGIWRVDGASTLELDTVSDNGFVELTTVDLRFRCTEISGGGVYFWINADYTGGNFMPIVVTIDKLSDETQTTRVAIGGRDAVALPGMSSDFVSVRLLIDPDLDTVNVRINDVDQDTFGYTPYTPTGDPQRATLHEWGSDAEWDYVRIRVGGNTP